MKTPKWSELMKPFLKDEDQRAILDLYNEKAGILDGDDEADVDFLICLPDLGKMQ